MDLVVDVLIDSIKDTAQLVPFLFLTYLAMEAIEHSTEGRVRSLMERVGALGPIVGGPRRASAVRLLGHGGHALLGRRDHDGHAHRGDPLHVRRDGAGVPRAPGARLEARSPSSPSRSWWVSPPASWSTSCCASWARREQGMHIHELCERAECHCDDATTAEERAPRRPTTTTAPSTTSMTTSTTTITTTGALASCARRPSTPSR